MIDQMKLPRFNLESRGYLRREFEF